MRHIDELEYVNTTSFALSARTTKEDEPIEQLRANQAAPNQYDSGGAVSDFYKQQDNNQTYPQPQPQSQDDQ